MLLRNWELSRKFEDFTFPYLRCIESINPFEINYNENVKEYICNIYTYRDLFNV